jgi:hypothetical protein
MSRLRVDDLHLRLWEWLSYSARTIIGCVFQIRLRGDAAQLGHAENDRDRNAEVFFAATDQFWWNEAAT